MFNALIRPQNTPPGPLCGRKTWKSWNVRRGACASARGTGAGRVARADRREDEANRRRPRAPPPHGAGAACDGGRRLRGSWKYGGGARHSLAYLAGDRSISRIQAQWDALPRTLLNMFRVTMPNAPPVLSSEISFGRFGRSVTPRGSSEVASTGKRPSNCGLESGPR
jgi:hypothetical protein